MRKQYYSVDIKDRTAIQGIEENNCKKRDIICYGDEEVHKVILLDLYVETMEILATKSNIAKDSCKLMNTINMSI